MQDKEPIILENEFYSKPFNFSYSSLNLLLYSPSAFYKKYILQQKEESLDSHLIEGKVIHALLLEESKFNDNFVISPIDLPGDNVRKLVHAIFNKVIPDVASKFAHFGEHILEELRTINLHQSLKTDEQRIAKVVTDETESYWNFLVNKGNKTVIDQETYSKCFEAVSLIKNNKSVMDLLNGPGKVQNELFVKATIPDKPFGLHGQIDNIVINEEAKTVIINDLKTSSKTLAEFKDSVEFYKYWLQAGIYTKMARIIYNLDTTWKVKFNFIVIDKYQQVFPFAVSDVTLTHWVEETEHIIEKANFHYSNKRYDLPYEFIVGNGVIL